MESLIEKYTRESGVRELDKRLAKIVRVAAKNIASETKYNRKLMKTMSIKLKIFRRIVKMQ